ncbi:MAG: amidohydrolase [Chloroflexota bacterium]|nr:MAG: amidohydrolase [Chloroflexota bacterium]
MPQPADLIITQARVYTADPAYPHVEAVAVQGRHIVFVGSAADAYAWRGPATRVIDGQGGTLLPGFIDSHFHLLWGSLELAEMQLGEVTSLDSLAAAVRRFAGEHSNNPWLVGRGLRYSIVPNQQSLTRHHLDAIIADQPLLVFAYDAHTAWANTAALRQANILTDGKTVGPNSEIVRAANGQASGELREPGAYRLLLELIPQPDGAKKRAMLRCGLAEAARVGVTSVHNMDGDMEQLTLYAALEDRGELTLRVYCPYSVEPETSPEALSEAVAMRRAFGSDMVRGGCVKFFMDGVIESYTGLLLDDYAGLPGNCGGALFSAGHFNAMAAEADRLGLQIFVHATGDGAVRRALDGFEAAQRQNGRRDSRHRIEHIELIHPDDVPRFAGLGVIASMQPAHVPLQTPDDPDVWPARVGPERWGRSFVWQTLRQAGARLAFGSDWPVAPQDPLHGLYAALNRRPWLPGLPEQRQSLADAIAAYTCDAAYAEFQEQAKGQLKPGMLADMVLLSADLFATPIDEIDRVHPIVTICDGRIVYEA